MKPAAPAGPPSDAEQSNKMEGIKAPAAEECRTKRRAPALGILCGRERNLLPPRAIVRIK